MAKLTIKQRLKLLELLKDYFNEDELRDIQFALGVDYEAIKGDNKAAKARELILHLERRDLVDELVTLCKRFRPNLSWHLQDSSPESLNLINFSYSLSDVEVDQLYQSGQLLEDSGLLNEAVAKYWRVKLARPDYSDVETRLTNLEHLLQKKFVSSEVQIKELMSLLDKSLMGTTTVAFLSGEAGIGKTTLANEFLRQAQTKYDNLIYVTSYCSFQSGYGDPFLPFKEILALLCGEVENQLSQANLSITNAKRLIQNAPFVTKTLFDISSDIVNALLPNMPNRSGDTKHSQIHNFTLSASPVFTYSNGIKGMLVYDLLLLFRKLTERFPLIIFLDDLQWSDPASIDLLYYLASNMRDRPFMLVGAFRSEGDNEMRKMLRSHIAEIQSRFHDTTAIIDLDGIDNQFVRFYVDQHYPNNEFPITFIAQLQHHTSNNALFVTELFHLLQERRIIYQNSQGIWQLVGNLSLEGIPKRVESIIEKRLESLTSDLKTILLTASIEGEEFSTQVIAQLQQINERDLIIKLAEELDKKWHLVTLSRSTILNQQRLHIYRFKHALIRTYLYQSIPPVKREFLHRDIGFLLEGLYRDGIEKFSPMLAEHFHKGKLPEKEIVYRLIAAKESTARGVWGTAIYHLNHLEKAIQNESVTLKNLDILTMKLYLLRGNLHSLIPDRDKALADYRKLQKTAEECQENFYLAYALLGYGILERNLGNFTGALKFATEALAITDKVAYPSLQADCYLLMAKSNKDLAKYGEAVTWADEAIAGYEQTNNLEGILDARSQIAYANYAQGNYDIAQAIWESNLSEAPEYASLSPDPDDDIYYCLGFLNWRLGNYERAKGFLSTALEFAEKTNNNRKQAYCLNNLGFVETSLGNFSQAESVLTRALSVFQKLGDRKGESWAYGNLGNVMSHSGRYEEAIEFLQKNRILATEIGLRSDLAEANRRLSEAYMHSGNLLEAYHYAQQSLKDAELIGRRAFTGMVYRVMGVIAVKVMKSKQEGFPELDKPDNYFQTSVKIAQETKSNSEEILSLMAWGEYLASLNDEQSQLKGQAFLREARTKLIDEHNV